MKCNNCKIENPNGARFCRGCGSVLSNVRSVMELYPEYSLTPASVFKLKPYMAFKFFVILLSIPYVFITICVFIASIINMIYYYTTVDAIVTICSLFALIIYYVFLIKTEYLLSPNRFRKRKKQLSEYDYIQDYTSRNEQYVFIVKNQKFGLYNVMRIKIQLTPDYDFLSWKTKGKILNATKNGRQFLIDIDGNELR